MSVRARAARVRNIFENPHLYDRAPIVIPFLVISIALGALAYRSWQLSVRMERGLDRFAVQYLGYAAEASARRTDTAVRTEMAAAIEQWQQIEQTNDAPDIGSILDWISNNRWIVSAIYLPDSEPEAAIYYSDETPEGSAANETREFFIAAGTVRYKYNPVKLLALVGKESIGSPVLEGVKFAEPAELSAQSKVEIIKATGKTGLLETAEGFEVVAPLTAPLSQWAVKASVHTKGVRRGWSSHRVVSVLFAIMAFVLLLVGTAFAIRGLAREADAMKLRADLIANVSHELRTPLSMIRLGAETLKRNANLSDADRESLQDSILREVVHLGHMVENVLDVARLQKGEKPLMLSPVYPSDLVFSLVETYHSWLEQKGFVVELEIDEEIEEQMWDREAVSRAVLNLIDNAVKYSTSEKNITVQVSESEDTVFIAVRDRGVGIPQNELRRIFEPYYRVAFSDTESRRGAGLGLTLVHQIMRSHGGSVEAESIPEQGATFRLVFPKKTVKGRERVSTLSAVKA